MTIKATQRWLARKRYRALRCILASVLEYEPVSFLVVVKSLEERGFSGIVSMANNMMLGTTKGYSGDLRLYKYMAESVEYMGAVRPGFFTMVGKQKRIVLGRPCELAEADELKRLGIDFGFDFYWRKPFLTGIVQLEKRIVGIVRRNENRFQRVVCNDPVSFCLVLRKGLAFPSTCFNRGFDIAFRGRLRRIVEKENLRHVDVLGFEGNPDIFVPSDVYKVCFVDDKFPENFIWCVPKYDFLSGGTGSSFRCVVDSNLMKWFDESGDFIFQMSLQMYIRLLTECENIREEKGLYVFSRGYQIDFGVEVSFVALLRENQTVVVDAGLYAALKFCLVESDFNISQARRKVKSLVPAVKPECMEFVIQVVCYAALRETVSSDSVLSQDELSSWMNLLLPGVLLGRFVSLITGFIRKITSGLQRHKLGQVKYAVLSRYNSLPMGRGSLWLVDELVTGESRVELVGKSKELVEKFDKVNGYNKMLYQVFERFLPEDLFSEEVQLIGNRPIEGKGHNAVAKVNACFSQLGGDLLMARKEWSEKDINESNIELPEALWFKTSISPSQTYKGQKLHRPRAGVRELPRIGCIENFSRALKVRNFGVAHLDSRVDGALLFENHIELHARICYVPNWRDLVQQFRINPIEVDNVNAERLVAAMKPEKRDKFLRCELKSLETAEFSEFLIALKGKAKDSVTGAIRTKEPQTVFFLGPENSGSAQAAFAEANRRKKLLYRSCVYEVDGLSDEDIEQRLNAVGVLPEGAMSCQRDLSQYDKSWSITDKEIVMQHDLMLGLKADFLRIYYGLDKAGRISARVLGLYLKLLRASQQSSGLPTTLMGNSTLNALSATKTGGYISCDDVISMVIQGDDIEIVTRPGFKHPENVEEVSASIFNLVEKNVILPKEARFNCSRFYVEVRGVQCLVYSPWAFLLKFGQALTMYEYSKLSERYVAYRQLLRHYSDVEVREKVAIAATYVYEVEANKTLQAFDAVLEAMVSEERFIKMWEEKPIQV